MRSAKETLKPQLVDIILREKDTMDVKRRKFKYLDSIFHFHDHNVYEMVWVEKSFGKRFVGDHIEDFEENDLVLMGPQLPHKWINDNVYYDESNELYARTTVIHFRGDLIANMLEDTDDYLLFEQLRLKSKRGICLLRNSREQALLLMQQLVENKGLRRIILFLQVLELFCHTEEYELLASLDYKNSIDAKESKRLNDVYEYVTKQFQHPVSLKEISKMACMSPTAFCRFFKKHRGTTFIDFLNQIRISHACKLLRETEDSITDVCFSSGFNNTVHFNKIFKKIKSLTPQHYRANLQNMNRK